MFSSYKLKNFVIEKKKLGSAFFSILASKYFFLIRQRTNIKVQLFFKKAIKN